MIEKYNCALGPIYFSNLQTFYHANWKHFSTCDKLRIAEYHIGSLSQTSVYIIDRIARPFDLRYPVARK